MRDAKRLLRLVRLPPGAVRVSTEPRGAGGLSSRPAQSATAELVDRHDWWRTRAAYSSVVAFLNGHRQSGTSVQGSDSEGGPGVASNRSLTLGLPAIPGVISSRSLLVWVVALRGGETGIRVDAQDVWIVPRPAIERVPSGVREIDITSARPHRRPIVSLRVTAPAEVRRIVSLIDRMETAQPGVTSCPALLADQPVVTFDFSARAGGPLLAQATLTAYGFPSGPCNAVSFKVHGRVQKPLLGGNFLTQVERLLDIRFR